MVSKIISLMSLKARTDIKKSVDPLFDKITKGIDDLGAEVVKLRAENKELKKQLGLIESEDPLILTHDMEVKDGHN